MAKKVIHLTESEMKNLIQKTVERALNESKNEVTEKEQVTENVEEGTIMNGVSDQTIGIIMTASPMLAMLGFSAKQVASEYSKFKKANPNATSGQCLSAAMKKFGETVSGVRR